MPCGVALYLGLRETVNCMNQRSRAAEPGVKVGGWGTCPSTCVMRSAPSIIKQCGPWIHLKREHLVKSALFRSKCPSFCETNPTTLCSSCPSPRLFQRQLFCKIRKIESQVHVLLTQNSLLLLISCFVDIYKYVACFIKCILQKIKLRCP